MKPAPFDYLAPTTVEETLAVLREHGEDAKVLAGGQSLVPMLNFRLARPAVLVDINRVQGLDGLDAHDGELRVGATVRQRALERSEAARERLPLVVEAVGLVGHPATRNRGTVAGSLAHADPSAELPAAMLACEATLVARGPGGERVLPAGEFFTDAFRTALAPDELLIEVRIPAHPAGAGGAFVELSRRTGDLPLCGVAALVALDDGGRCRRARVALCGVGRVPARAVEAERVLEGEVLGAESIAEAAERATDGLRPVGSVHGSAAYRRRIAAAMTRRALEMAARRSRDGERSGA